MRSSSQSRRCPLLLPTLLSIAALIQLTLAGPYPRDDLHDTRNYGFLQDRLCASYCGSANEHCCSDGEVCTTSDSTAGCARTTSAPLSPIDSETVAVYTTTWTEVEVAPLVQRDGGGESLYTTTWTETETFTSTGTYGASSTAVAGGGGACTPTAGTGDIACGSICCATWQYCAYEGQCMSNAGATNTEASSYSTFSTTMTTHGSTITTQYSAPYRVTGTGTGSTTTTTGTAESATATGSGNGTAVATTGGSTLSGGAIAGIVIGTLAGVVILLTICACCIMRGLWHGLLALLGLGPKRKRRDRSRETVIIEEERYSRHGGAGAVRTSSHADRDRHRSWFSGRPAASAAGESRRTSEKRRESNQTSWWGAGALGTLLVLLGLRRDKKRRQSTATKRTSRPRSTVSSSYFSDSYTASSPSEFSSDYTYSSVYTPAPHQSQPPRGGPRSASVVRSHSVRSASAAGGGRVYREDYDYDHPPKSNLPPEYAGSASSGGRTRDTRRSRRTETTRVSRAPSRR